MPSCAAQGCSSRSDKGNVLKVFPRKDLRRRQVWIDRVNRPGWLPHRYSALCERHFDRDQWELPREDGKRKLKSNAVPSIFCVQYPSEDDVVANDHAYCILGYRPLFDNHCDLLVKEEGTDILPIEHIKVEVDENENIAEDVLVEKEYESDKDYKKDEGLVENIQYTPDEALVENIQCTPDEASVENIQCTPDIFMFAETNEPEPIESVDCEEEDANSFINDPSIDPLAISSEDVEQAGQLIPNFSHSTKYLFVTKDSKMVSKLPPVVEGEPVVASASPQSPPRRLLPKSSILIPPPGSKVLFKNISSPPKLTPFSKLMIPKKYTKYFVNNGTSLPKLTPIRKAGHISIQKGLSPPKLTPISKFQIPCTKRSSPPVLTPIPKTLNILFPKGSSPPKLIPISTSLQKSPVKVKLLSPCNQSPPIKLKIVSQPNDGLSASSNKNLMASKKRFVAQPTLQKAPEYLHSPLSVNAQSSSDEPLPKPSQKTHFICINENKKLVSSLHENETKEFNSVAIKTDGNRSDVSSVNNSVNLKNIFLEHHYTKKQSYESSTLNGTQPILSCKNGSKKNLRKLLGAAYNTKSKTSPSHRTASSGLLSRFKPGLLTKASSVVVLSPFYKSESSKPLSSNGKKSSRNLNLYKCPVCKLAFLSLGYLQKHLTTHEELMVSNNEEEYVKPHKTENTKVIKGPKYSQKKYKWITSKYENPSNVQKFEKDMVLIPNLKAWKKSTDDEFIRLSNLVSMDPNNEDGIKKNNVAEHNSKSDSDECSTSTGPQNPKLKGCFIDESGRRHSLRKKIKTFKSKMSYAQKVNKRQRTENPSIKIKNNPVVLLSKIDLNRNSNVDPTKDLNMAIDISDDDCDEGWKGWDESKAGCDFNNDKLTEKSVKFSNAKKTTLSKTNKEKKSKSGSKSLTKNIILGRNQTHKKVLNESLSEVSQNLSQNETNSKDTKVKCPTCELLIQKSTLKRHILLHAKYSCKLCTKKFEKSFLLRRHVLHDHKVVKQFSCLRRDCSRRFETKRDMEKHMRSHRK